MDTTKTKTHAGPLLGSRWAQMWAYMWAEQLVIFWYMLPKVTLIRTGKVKEDIEKDLDSLQCFYNINTIWEYQKRKKALYFLHGSC